MGPPKTKHGFREIPLTKANREMLLEMKKQADRGRYVQEEFKEFVNLYVHVTDEEKTKEMQKFEEYSIKI